MRKLLDDAGYEYGVTDVEADCFFLFCLFRVVVNRSEIVLPVLQSHQQLCSVYTANCQKWFVFVLYIIYHVIIN